VLVISLVALTPSWLPVAFVLAINVAAVNAWVLLVEVLR
jgi:hypothetical protein